MQPAQIRNLSPPNVLAEGHDQQKLGAMPANTMHEGELSTLAPEHLSGTGGLPPSGTPADVQAGCAA